MTPAYIKLLLEVHKLMGRCSYRADEPGWEHIEPLMVRAISSANRAMRQQNYTSLVLARDELKQVV